MNYLLNKSVLLVYSDNIRLFVEPVNNVKYNQHNMTFDSFKGTVLEVLEAVWGLRVKAKECVHMCVGLRGKMCLYASLSGPLWCFHIWALYSSPVLLSSSVLPSNLYASSSNPNPILCPPPFTFFPSIRPERVSFTPAGIRVGLCIINNAQGLWIVVT